MTEPSYRTRRSEIETYFDRTAAEAWKRLTSDAPLGRVRATVRAGRDEMRQTLLDWLPNDLTGCRLLDAGCGTGLLTIAAARRGAQVVAVDLSATLVQSAQERQPADIPANQIEWLVGDMLDPKRGQFDYIVAMDSLIHYELNDALQLIGGFAQQARAGVLFTFAPRTPALTVMHAVGKWFPRSDRSPAIIPVNDKTLLRQIASMPELVNWTAGRNRRIKRGFYISHGLELVPR
ncbi:magnesium protoporphyrin IX methyltransferase [Rhodopseudomonas palustris]|uniref:Magnesium protoporphyrin IX methyltransferase n=1 Tax=Thiospirillum jenense TaxID=1653858 RepID=A0A839H504_9GAMM|nr:magnesium protoporphyrin IX methyltransferase [Thiospirillum jenense]MBB1089739.1 magnesium protoporphyrin IX methyltransferase [Rhodopseudomonas palustris]MBB1124841.1 magnesium protoporphyrin IX methyltransferase [Thiospirillum jenense]